MIKDLMVHSGIVPFSRLPPAPHEFCTLEEEELFSRLHDLYRWYCSRYNDTKTQFVFVKSLLQQSYTIIGYQIRYLAGEISGDTLREDMKLCKKNFEFYLQSTKKYAGIISQPEIDLLHYLTDERHRLFSVICLEPEDL